VGFSQGLRESRQAWRTLQRCGFGAGGRTRVTIRDELVAEERWVTLGRDSLSRVLVVVYTWRADNVRIISARKATPAERKRYEEYDES
jgi:hypothetical protein